MQQASANQYLLDTAKLQIQSDHFYVYLYMFVEQVDN